jgi:hypothetical protein
VRLTGTEILATGDEIYPDGARPAAWLMIRNVLRTVRKREHVPFLELTAANASPLVLETAAGRAAVLICYDAVRYSAVRAAVSEDPEFLLSPSDNASYQGSTLTEWQRVASTLLAIEHGRPLLLVLSRGPSILVEPAARRITTLGRTSTAAMTVVDVPLVRGRTWATRGGRTIAGLLLLGAAWSLGRQIRRREPRDRLRALLAVPTIVFAATAWLVGATSGAAFSLHIAGGDLGDVVRHQVRQGRATAAFDGASQAFRQDSPNGCGPAALAWALFGLGDTVDQRELRLGSEPHSLANLADLATDRGFRARAFVGDIRSLSSARDVVYVLHLSADHFVGCRARVDGRYAVFDPESGALVIVDGDSLSEQWSGHALEIRLAAPL